MARHWHAMNGSIGCMPDNNEVHTSKASAIESLCSLFADCSEVDEMRKDLEFSTYYFDNPREAGADYAEVTECYEEDCCNEG